MDPVTQKLMDEVERTQQALPAFVKATGGPFFAAVMAMLRHLATR